ncbi:MAG: hypothetical protein R3C01_13110 [Planctomycetaceae bacterium]
MNGLMVERLEDRILLAASVSFQSGTLSFTGDGGVDHVSIDGWGEPGLVRVAYHGPCGSEQTIEFYENVNNIVINTKGGADFVHIASLDISGSVTVNTGGGNDYLGFFESSIGGSFSAKMGGGSDFLTTANNLIAGTASINMGGGLDGVDYYNTDSVGKLTMKFGGGNDHALLLFNDVAEGSVVSGDGGKDLFFDLDEPLPTTTSLVKIEVQTHSATPEIDDLWYNDFLKRGICD